MASRCWMNCRRPGAGGRRYDRERWHHQHAFVVRFGARSAPFRSGDITLVAAFLVSRCRVLSTTCRTDNRARFGGHRAENCAGRALLKRSRQGRMRARQAYRDIARNLQGQLTTCPTSPRPAAKQDVIKACWIGCAREDCSPYRSGGSSVVGGVERVSRSTSLP